MPMRVSLTLAVQQRSLLRCCVRICATGTLSTMFNTVSGGSLASLGDCWWYCLHWTVGVVGSCLQVHCSAMQASQADQCIQVQMYVNRCQATGYTDAHSEQQSVTSTQPTPLVCLAPLTPQKPHSKNPDTAQPAAVQQTKLKHRTRQHHHNPRNYPEHSSQDYNSTTSRQRTTKNTNTKITN